MKTDSNHNLMMENLLKQYFPQAKAEVYNLAEKPSVEVILYKKVCRDLLSMTDTEAEVKAVMEPMIDLVTSSRPYKNKVHEMQCQIDELKSVTVDLKKEVKALKPFKNYFEVQMKLNHGGGKE